MRGVLGLFLILVLVVFLLSNRDDVGLGFWPFGFTLAVPLGALVLVTLVGGFVAGLLFHLPGRLSNGRRARLAEKRLAALQARPAPPLVP